MAAFIHSTKCLLPYPNPFFFSSPASLLCVRPSLACAGAAVEISPSNPGKEKKKEGKVVHNSIMSTHIASSRNRREKGRTLATLFYHSPFPQQLNVPPALYSRIAHFILFIFFYYSLVIFSSPSFHMCTKLPPSRFSILLINWSNGPSCNAMASLRWFKLFVYVFPVIRMEDQLSSC